MPAYVAVWRARLQMARPGNAAMAAVGVLVGLEVARTGPVELAAWVGAPLAAFFIAAFGNVLNDLADAELDRMAHPGRPLPSGRLSAANAKTFAVLLLALGLWESYAAFGTATLAFALVNAALLGLYEWRVKRAGLPGNLLVALLVASTFAFGAVASGSPPASWGLLWLLMGLAFLANAAREVLKDVEDMEADRGVRATLPLRAGPGAARLLAFALVNAAVLISLLAFVRSPPDWWTWWRAPLALADIIFLVGAALAWVSVPSAQRLLKAAMVLALSAFLAGPMLGT